MVVFDFEFRLNSIKGVFQKHPGQSLIVIFHISLKLVSCHSIDDKKNKNTYNNDPNKIT